MVLLAPQSLCKSICEQENSMLWLDFFIIQMCSGITRGRGSLENIVHKRFRS